MTEYEHRFMVSGDDAELQAIQIIRTVLRDLEPDRKRAVLKYMKARIERDEKTRPTLSGWSTQGSAAQVSRLERP